MIRLCQHCISREETRYYLHGIFLHQKPGGDTLRAVATDGHRLACIDSTDPVDLSSHDQRGVIVPHTLIAKLKPLLGKGGNEPVAITVQRHKIRISTGTVEVMAKTIDGKYPDYSRVIPAPSDRIVATLSRDLLQRLTRAATGLDGVKNVRIAAKFDPAAGQISAGRHDGGVPSLRPSQRPTRARWSPSASISPICGI
ncbi:DNA polymerase III subunit beta family protein, partial [Paenirhodobacter populi]